MEINKECREIEEGANSKDNAVTVNDSNNNANVVKNTADNIIKNVPSISSAYSNKLIETVNDLGNLSQIASYYTKSSLCRHKTEADFIVAAIAGKELNLSLTQSINNIISIQGTPSLPIQLIKALFLRAKILYKVIEDYVPLYGFYRTDVDGKVIKTNDGKPILVTVDTADAVIPRTKVSLSTIVDYRSTYLFTRYVKVDSNTTKEIEVKGSFTWSDAIAMGLAEKDNYRKQPKTMIRARAFSSGAREIGADIMLGMYSDVELADSFNQDYNYNDSDDADAIIIEENE